MTDKVTNTLDKLPVIADTVGLEYDTPHGVLLFTKRECDYYGKLFDMLDWDEDEEVVGKEITAFLKRSKLDQKSLAEMWLLGGCEEDSKPSLERYEFFIVLKLIACAQVDDGVFDIDDLTLERPLPLPDFGLSEMGPDEVDDATDPDAPLSISIDGTKEVGSFLKKHTEYVIKCHTTYPHFMQEDPKVSRRYNDFVWLHQRLTERFPQCMVPPLPEKQFSGRFASDFVETRRLALQTFFNEIVKQKELATSVDLMIFLCSSDKGLAQAQTIMGSLEKMNLVTAMKNIGQSVAGAVSGQQGVISDEDREFKEVEVELDQFKRYIGSVHETTNQIVSKNKDIGTSFDTISTAFNTLAETSEGNQEETDYYNTCSTNFGEVSIALSGYAEALRSNLLTPIGFTQNKTKSINGLIINRQKAKAKVRESEKLVEKRRKELTEARSKGRDKVSVAQENLDDARDLRFDKRSKAREVLVGLRDGYIKFEKDKVTDLSSTIKNYVNNQIEFYKVQSEQWERILQSFKYTPEEIEEAKKLVVETQCEENEYLDNNNEEDDDNSEDDHHHHHHHKDKKSSGKHSHDKKKDKKDKHSKKDKKKSKKDSSSSDDDSDKDNSDSDSEEEEKRKKKEKKSSKKDKKEKKDKKKEKKEEEEESAPAAPEVNDEAPAVAGEEDGDKKGDSSEDDVNATV